MPREARIRGVGYNQWMESADSLPFLVEVNEWDRSDAIQCLAGDMDLAAGYGSSTSTAPVYAAAIMGNVIGSAALTATANIIAAVIGKYSHTGTSSSTYMSAAVVGEIGAGVTAPRAAVMAVMSGESATGVASVVPAAFGVDWNTSTVATRFTYGLDLEGPASHDSYAIPRYNSGFIRMGGRVRNAAGTLVTINDLILLGGTAATSDGTAGTGAGYAGPGSLYMRQDGASSTLLINTGTMASPTWSAIP